MPLVESHTQTDRQTDRQRDSVELTLTSSRDNAHVTCTAVIQVSVIYLLIYYEIRDKLLDVLLTKLQNEMLAGQSVFNTHTHTQLMQSVVVTCKTRRKQHSDCTNYR